MTFILAPLILFFVSPLVRVICIVIFALLQCSCAVHMLSYTKYMHEIRHTQIRTYTHTYSYVPAHTHMYTNMRTYPYGYTYVHTHSYMHTYAHSYTDTHTHTQTHVHAHMQSYKHTHTHTRIHAHNPMHTMHTRTQPNAHYAYSINYRYSQTFLYLDLQYLGTSLYRMGNWKSK